jgi:hypothetical protein
MGQAMFSSQVQKTYPWTTKGCKSHALVLMGASMVKWTQKMLQYTRTIFFGQRPKSSNKALFKLYFFHDDLNCCVEYSNVENQVEMFNTYH